MSPCCGCDPWVRETMRPSKLKMLSFIGLSAAARDAMCLWGVILLCRLCQRPRIFFRLTASLMARLYTQPHGDICCNSLKIVTYLKYIQYLKEKLLYVCLTNYTFTTFHLPLILNVPGINSNYMHSLNIEQCSFTEESFASLWTIVETALSVILLMWPCTAHEDKYQSRIPIEIC